MRETVFSAAHTETLLADLRRANTEQAKKELFLQYLTRAFVKDKGAQRLIILLGHEEILRRGARFARQWFAEAEKIWDEYRTDKALNKMR